MHGLSPLYRLYPCAEGQWVFLAIPTADEQHRFRDTLLDAGYDTPPAELLAANDVQTATALTELFGLQTADAWQALLTPAHVACVRADAAQPSEFWLSDEQTAANDFIAPAEHPKWGAYRRHGPMVKFSGTTQTLRGPPLAGQHNGEVLRELGYDNAEIGELAAAGVLWQEQADA